MKLLEDRIKKDGIICGKDILKVGSFLNQNMDVPFILELGKEFYRLYKDSKITKILTIEASGIGIACLAATYFETPVLFAKKSKTSNIAGDVFSSKVHSFTHGNDVDVIVPKDFLDKNDRVLLIDDFLANGSALSALIDIVSQAGAEVVGAGIVIEKKFEGGGNALRKKGYRIESLAKISSMSEEDGIVFCD